jgi:hypothetical protein
MLWMRQLHTTTTRTRSGRDRKEVDGARFAAIAATSGNRSKLQQRSRGLVDAAAAIPQVGQRTHKALTRSRAMHWFERWISEIMADFWSVARLGVGSTLGLLAVLSLPKSFVFIEQLCDGDSPPVRLRDRSGTCAHHPKDLEDRSTERRRSRVTRRADDGGPTRATGAEPLRPLGSRR